MMHSLGRRRGQEDKCSGKRPGGEGRGRGRLYAKVPWEEVSLGSCGPVQQTPAAQGGTRVTAPECCVYTGSGRLRDPASIFPLLFAMFDVQELC